MTDGPQVGICAVMMDSLFSGDRHPQGTGTNAFEITSIMIARKSLEI